MNSYCNSCRFATATLALPPLDAIGLEFVVDHTHPMS